MKIDAAGTAYSRTPSSPHAVYVEFAARDFFNPVSFAIKPNTLPHPDGFPVNKPTSSGGASANEFGYLGGQALLDLSQAMRAQGMEFIQSVYIDNSMGAGVVVLRNRATKMQVTAPPFTQGYYPMLLPIGSIFTFDVANIDSLADNNSTLPSFGTYPDVSTDHSGAGGLFYNYQVESGFVRMQFTDVAMPAAQWNTRNTKTGIWYDFPTTIVAAGVFQTVWNPNPFRKGFLIGNAINAVEALYLSLHQEFETDTKQASIGLSPGQYYVERGDPAYIGAVRVAADTVGHVVVAKELQ